MTGAVAVTVPAAASGVPVPATVGARRGGTVGVAAVVGVVGGRVGALVGAEVGTGVAVGGLPHAASANATSAVSDATSETRIFNLTLAPYCALGEI